MNALIGREALLRRMEDLKEKNKKLEERFSTLNSDIFGDVGEIRSKI